MDANFNQPAFATNFVPQNAIFPPPLPAPMNSRTTGRRSTKSDRFQLHFPALILLAFCWLLHTIATFIPYWSVNSSISDSRAGLWSARNFDYQSIQNFYFPELLSFPTITDSIRFTSANTKGYIVTVQFLMTFNFVLMTILLILLIVDYVFSGQTPEPHGVLVRKFNTPDTALIYGLLLYVLYVFTVFEFAAWITYVASRHDNNWTMHVSFAFTVIVSVFLIGVFVMYVIEFLQIFKKNRTKWDYWYGPYSEWGFFVHLTALFLLLIVICCPEWAYVKTNTIYIFGEIGLFKQCFLSLIYKKSRSTTLCTLSDTRNNQSWVNATQAFILMALIFGTIFLILMVVFRKEFRHNAKGYQSDRVSQPRFTFIIAGLILFFCFIFSLIGVSIFGGKVFRLSITVNWAYILAVIAMVLFLIAGILFILDGIHSRKQTTVATGSSMEKFFFPEPLNTRILAMQPLIKPEPVVLPMALPAPWPMISPLWQPMLPFNMGQPPPMYSDLFYDNPSFFPSAASYGMDPSFNAPIAQATLSNYFQQMMDNPQLLSSRNNQGLNNYSAGDLFNPSINQRGASPDDRLNEMIRLQLLQQQRLNYNHERLLERYGRLRAPRVSEYRSFGISSLPGRNYDRYLEGMRDGEDYNRLENSLIAQSRARIGASDGTYRLMGDEDYQSLPRDINSVFQNRRNDPRPFVRAEKVESRRISDYLPFERISGSIRSIFTQTTRVLQTQSRSPDHREERKIFTLNNQTDDNQLIDRVSSEYPSNPPEKTSSHFFIDSHLFNIYNQRLNGDIQSYGQSLYAPSNSNEYVNVSFVFNNESITSKILSTTSNDFPTERLSNLETTNDNSSREEEHSIANNLHN